MKIKYLIDTFLSPSIAALDWVGRYGGVVKTLYKEVQEKGGKTTIKKFPIACDVTPVDCENQSIFETLIPDDAFKSVVYWEEVSPFTNIGQTQTKKFNERKFKGTARIVVWLNLAKLGITNCKDGALTIPSLEKILTKQGKIQSGVFAGSHLWIIPKQVLQQDINTIFGKYDYPKLKNFFAYPFDFYAIDVDFEMNQCLSNDTTLPISQPVDCYNDLGVSDCDKVKALLTDELLLNCVLPLFDFADTDTQNALSNQQKTDLTNYLCTPCTPIDELTCQQLSENLTPEQLNECLLPLYDFSDSNVTNNLTGQQIIDLQAAFCSPCPPLSSYSCQDLKDGLTDVQKNECLLPDYDFADTAVTDNLTAGQISDLQALYCTPVPPTIQYTMQFDGVNESVNCYDKPAYNFTNLQPFTITSWVKSSNYGGSNQGIMTKRSGAAGGTGWTFFFLSGDLYALLQNGIFYILVRTNGVTFANNVWIHVALTVSGSGVASGVKMYRNGVQLTTVTLQDNLNASISNTSPVIIGSETALAMPFNGNIGYSRLFNIELSGAQVLTDYNSGVMLENSPQVANQVLGWKAGQGALFGSPLADYWLFPDELDNTLIAPFSTNMEYVDRTTDIPT